MHHATRIKNKSRTALERPLSRRVTDYVTPLPSGNTPLNVLRVRGKALPWQQQNCRHTAGVAV